MRFQAKTNDKRQLDVDWSLVNAYLSKYKPGTVLDFEIIRHQKRKSDPMRKYFFAAVLPAYADHLGYDKQDHLLLHHQLKITFFGIQPDKKGIYLKVPSVYGNESKVPISQKKDYCDWVIRKAAHDGVYISDPNEK